MFFQAIINSILYGFVYAIIGIGFSLVWGVMNNVNLAHGSFIMVGAYLAITFHSAFGLSPFLSIPLVMAILFLIAYAIQYFLLNRVRSGSSFINLTFTYGLQILIANICQLIWGSDFRSINLPYAGQGFFIGPLVIPYVRFFIFIATVLVIAVFYLFMGKTRTGRAIHATALNPIGAQTVGVDTNYIYAITFAVSAALAGVAGALISPIMSINPFLGGSLISKAFVIAILGGLGSTLGAVVGGLLLSLVETLGALFLSSSVQEFLGFLVLIIVLVIKPQGLMGKRFY